MLIKKEENNENNINQNNDNINEGFNNEQIQQNIREVLNNRNPRNMRRGFNIFLLHGLSNIELRTMRVLFHLSAYHQSMLRGNQLDWSEEGMLEREERWLINQLNGPLLNNNNNNNGNNNNDNEQERDNEREMINRNNNYISLNINANENDDLIRRRYITNLINFEFEPNYLFLIGFCFGFLVNIFGFILLLCKFKRRFKIGLFCGIIISMLFYSLTILSLK